MESAALRKIEIYLEVDEALKINYAQFQEKSTNTNDDPKCENNTTEKHPNLNKKSNNNNNDSIVFPESLRMFPWNDIEQMSQYIYQQTRIPPDKQRLFFRGREITAYNSINIHNRKKKKKKKKLNSKNKKLTSPTLSFFGITHKSTVYLQCRSATEEQPIVPYGTMSNSIIQDELIKECVGGLWDYLLPRLASDGEGGTYFLRNSSGKNTACFKPADEEAGCINNPRGHILSADSMNSGIKPSEGHLREIAAYLIDSNSFIPKYNGFHCVPPTIRAEILCKGFNYINDLDNGDDQHILPKIGALQKFISGEVIENFGIKNFSQRQIHKIGILDIRILNCDRNSGNVIVSKNEFGRYELIPIDHGLSLPKKLEITRDSWVWLNWEQSKQPFDPHTKEFINNINIDNDINILSKELNISSMSFENMRIANIVLKKSTNRGLTLHEIGNIIARPDFDTPSILEKLIEQAETLAKEKNRQNRHFLTRMRHNKNRKKKARQSMQSLHSAYHEHNNPSPMSRTPHNPHSKHIYQKFLEKGKTLKSPIVSLSNNNNNNNNNNSNQNNKYQLVNKNKDRPTIIRNIPLMPAPLGISSSLGALALGRSNLSSFAPTLIKSKVNGNNHNNHNNNSDNDNKFDIGFLTPSFTSTANRPSTQKKLIQNVNQFRSLTPGRKRRTRMSRTPDITTLNDHSNSIPHFNLCTESNQDQDHAQDHEKKNKNEKKKEELHLHDEHPLNMNVILKSVSINSDADSTTTATSNDENKDSPLNAVDINPDIFGDINTEDIEINDENDENLNNNNNNKAHTIMPFNSLQLDMEFNDLSTLRHSQSCIAVNKSKINIKSSTHTNNMEIVEEFKENPIIAPKNKAISKDDDNFLYGLDGDEMSRMSNHSIHSKSLINDRAMLKFKDEYIKNGKNNNLNIMSIIDVAEHNNNYSMHSNAKSPQAQHSPPLIALNLNSNPSNPSSNSIDHMNRTPSNSHSTQQSIDDNIRQSRGNDSNFGMHPILHRMMRETAEVRKFFYDYLEQLLGIQCIRISKREKNNKIDKNDDIYDVDSVEGSFIWKNELRHKWIKSRVAYKKYLKKQEEQLIQKENPLNKVTVPLNDDQQEDNADDIGLFFEAEQNLDYDYDSEHLQCFDDEDEEEGEEDDEDDDGGYHY